MSSAQPQNTPHADDGLLYVNQSEASNYQPLRVERGDNHLYWQSTYQNLLLGYANFGDFFPRAEFSDNGNRVIFTKYIDGTEVLGKSRTLRSAECIDRLEWDRFLTTWRSFKSLASQSGMPEDVRTFIINFAPSSIELFPSAYRIYKRRWYSKPRLFILWGFEPVGGPQFVDVSPDLKIAELQTRVESSATNAKNNLLRLSKWCLLGLLSLAVIMLLVWLFLPTPISDFDINAQVNRPADIVNKTSFESPFKYGSTTYLWNFQNANPTKSVEFQPSDVVWTQPALATVSLEVKQSTMFGLLSKKDISNKIITITLPTKDTKGLDSSLPGPSIPESVPVPDSPLDRLPSMPSLPDPGIPNPEAVHGQRSQMTPDNTDNVKDSGLGSSSSDTEDKGKSLPNSDNSSRPEINDDTGQKAASNKADISEDGQPVPAIIIKNQTLIRDGSESQKIEFNLSLNENYKLNSLTIDGTIFNITESQRLFVSTLKKGKHIIEFTYSNSSGAKDTVKQELNVDITPENKLGPPIKRPTLNQPDLPRDNSPKKIFNTKLA